MKPRNAEASRLEADYLHRVRAELKDREQSEVEEVIQSLREHIDEELSDVLDAEVRLVQMANVLERLGPPEAYASEDGSGPPAAPSHRAEPKERSLSKIALASALCLPAAILVGILAGVLAHMASEREHPSEATAWIGVLSGTAMLFVGLTLGIVALRAIRNQPEKLSGRGLAWIGVIQLPAVWVLLLMWLMSGSTASEPPQRVEPDPPPLHEGK